MNGKKIKVLLMPVFLALILALGTTLVFASDYSGGRRYTISYNANQGEGAPESQIKEKNVPLLLSSQVPERFGYTFMGWARSKSRANLGKIDYVAGGYIKYNGNRTLYAVWKANSYTISYDGNGSTKGTTKNTVITYNSSFRLRSCGFSKTGYSFKGWTLVPVASPETAEEEIGTADFASLQKFSAARGLEFLESLDYSRDIKIYALWDLTEYSLSYKNIKKGAVNTNPSYYVITQGVSSFEALDDSGVAGYSFVGWYSDSRLRHRIETIDAGSCGSRTIYASWRAYSYTVSFNPGQGSGNISDINASYDKSFRLPSGGVSRPGYRLTGWYCAETGKTYGTGKYVKNLCTEDGGSITLTAVWTPRTKSLTFNSNYPVSSLPSRSVKLTLSSDSIFPSDTFSCTWYRIKEWNTKKDGSGISFPAGSSALELIVYNSSVSNLYAIWEDYEEEGVEGHWGKTAEGGGTTWYCYEGAENIKHALKNTDTGKNVYSQRWEYWMQGASQYRVKNPYYTAYRTREGAMRYGCIVLAESKLLVESGIASKDPAEFNPDLYFVWGTPTYFNPHNTFRTGNPLSAYAQEKGYTIKKIGTYRLSGRNKSSDSDKIMNYINRGYYVIVRTSTHWAYIGRQASLESGHAVYLDSTSYYSVNSQYCKTVEGSKDNKFRYMEVFSVVKNETEE